MEFEDPDAWKPKPEIDSSIEELGVGLRPHHKIKLYIPVNEPGDSHQIFSSRNTLLDATLAYDGLLAYVGKTNEWFQYSENRNLWMLIKKV